MTYDKVNPLRDFVFEEYHARIDAEFHDKHLAEQESQLRPVTVRLHPDVVNTVDALSRYFDTSRQKMMEQLIEGGISLTYSSLADAEVAGYPGYEKMTEDEQRKIWQETRLKFVMEVGE